MRVGFAEGVLAVMVFRFMFNVCSLVLMFFLVLFLDILGQSVHAYLVDMFCLIYVLVRLLGLYSEAVLLMLSGFLVLVSPITNTCVNAKHMHRDCFFLLGGCQVSHLPLSFFPLSFLCFLFFADALIFNTSGRPRTCANLSCVILCHLASLCRLALMLLLFL